MGWRDINMTRRRPQPRFAAVSVLPGEDFSQSVMRKAAGRASHAIVSQFSESADPVQDGLAAFMAGYLLGFARHAATQDGVDCETGAGGGDMTRLAQELCRQCSGAHVKLLPNVTFVPRMNPAKDRRTGLVPLLAGDQGLCEAGYLVGHLESLCGARKLVALAREKLLQDDATAGAAFLTGCDVAADPMQTRAPTLSLRFEADERAVILAAFEAHGGSARTR